MSEQTETSNHRQKPGWRSLSVTMSIQMLLITIAPLIIVAVAVVISLSRSVENLEQCILSTRQEMAHDVVGTTLQGEAEVTMAAIDTYMGERIHDVTEWANTLVVRRAAQEGATRAQELGLTALTETQIENKMKVTRALIHDAELEEYLTSLSVRTPAFTEMFFTDEHGFTVAYNNKPSDFVQAGEAWWDTAWDKGIYVGSVQYDDSAGVYSVEIAVRIDDAGGQPLGVLKAVLNISALQELATEARSRVTGSVVRLFTHHGDQIADTASENAPNMIMTDMGNLLQRNWESARLILEKHQEESGYLLDQRDLDGQPVVVGYAASAPGSTYGVQGFDGFAWVVTVGQPAEIAFAILHGLDEAVTQMSKTRLSILGLMLAVCVVTALGAIMAAVLTSRRIVRPIVRLASASQRISAGDLSTTVQVEQLNEIGELEDAFRRMSEQLRQMLDSEREQRQDLQRLMDSEWEQREHLQHLIVQIREATTDLSAAVAEILTATTQQVSGANEQSAAISQTTTIVEEVKIISEQSIERAQEVVDTSRRTIGVSRSGQQAVQDTLASMAHIKGRVEGIAENILTLSEQTQRVGEIIATVNDLAAQSNILALNASVEAARAGEHGKGFAVVAVEVRNLAEQSRQATTQVKTILLDIQKAINATVMATEEGTKAVDQGGQLAARTREIIEQLSGVIEESAQTAMQMMAGGQQQASGVEQIALAMQNISQATMQSLTSTHQTEKAARDLNELARRLTENVEQYQL